MKKLGLRAAAKALGLTHVALLKAERDGRVSKRDALGKFDVEACRKDLEANTNPVKSASAKQQRKQLPVTEIATPAGGADVPLQESIRRKEFALARVREMEADQKEGGLISLKDAEAAWAAMIGAARAKLLSLPSKLANELAMESDAATCEQLLKNEIYEALNELSAGDVEIGL